MLLSFTTPGGIIWINPDQVVAVRDAIGTERPASTSIATTAGSYGVLETLEEVLEKLQA